MKSNGPLTENSSVKMCERCGTEIKYGEVRVCQGGAYYKDWISECECEKKDRLRREAKLKGQGRIKLICWLKNIGLGKRYEKSVFKKQDFEIKAYKESLEYCRNLEENLKEGKGLFITGSVGTGKTHLVACIVDWIARIKKRKLQRDFYIKFATATNLLSEIRAAFNRKPNEETTEDIIEEYKACSLLIIDDLGAEKMTDWVGEIFYTIIDSRYSNLKSTIITTNLNSQELKEKLSERLMSRVYQMCKGIKVIGKDHRLEKF